MSDFWRNVRRYFYYLFKTPPADKAQPDAPPRSQSKLDGLWSTSDIPLSERLQIYETFRNYIRHEDGLINNRLGWMLTIHGFLYAAYAIVLSKQQDTIVSITSLAVGATASGLNIFLPAVNNTYQLLFDFRIAISIVGFLISILGWFSILAAIKSISSVARIFRTQSYSYTFDGSKTASEQSTIAITLSSHRGSKIYGTTEGFYLPRMAGGGTRQTAEQGSAAAMVIPLVLALVWLVSLLVSSFTHDNLVDVFKADVPTTSTSQKGGVCSGQVQAVFAIYNTCSGLPDAK